MTMIISVATVSSVVLIIFGVLAFFLARRCQSNKPDKTGNDDLKINLKSFHK